MRRLARWVSCGGLTLLTALPAAANSGGIVGVSGRPGTSICNSCHSAGGAVAPDVSFIGPSEMAVGSSATFRFEVHSKVPVQRAAGFNVAAAAGTLTIIAGQEARRSNGELTHTEPKDNDGNQVAAWEFTWTAPAAPGTYRLFGAGNSVNRNGQSSGDRATKTNFDVDVVTAVDPTATPTPSPPPPTASATPTLPPTASPTRTATLSPARTATASPTRTATATAAATTTATASASATAPATQTQDTGTPTPPDGTPATPSSTPTEPDATPTEPDATPTSTTEDSPTPTPTEAPPACVGDCNANGRVAINEIILAVNIALGSLPVEACRAADRNGNGAVAIGELVVAVGASLDGCETKGVTGDR
jgi:hypothetical protein